MGILTRPRGTAKQCSPPHAPGPPGAARDGEGWARHAEALADWALARLVVRHDVYGAYNPNRGQYTAHAPLTREDLVRHFQGKRTIGALAISADGKCLSLAFDIDAHDDRADPEANWRYALLIADRLPGYGLNALVFDSNGKGGYHVRVFFKKPVPSETAHWLGARLVADHADHGFRSPPEFFPKQESITLACPYGNWLRLPGRHHRRPHWMRIYDPDRRVWLGGEDAARRLVRVAGDHPGPLIEAYQKDLKARRPDEGKAASPDQSKGGRSTRRGDKADEADIRAALDSLPSDWADSYGGSRGHTAWLGVGMALHDWDPGAGLPLWKAFSSHSTAKYDPAVCDEKWATFTQGGGLSVGTIFKEAERNGWVPPWKGVGRDIHELRTRKAIGDRRPVAEPRDTVPIPIPEPTPNASVDPAEPTAIARAMLADLAAGRTALHLAPTGSGKSHSNAQVAIERCRNGQATLIAVPTVRLAREAADRIAELAPEIMERGAVAEIFGRTAIRLPGDDGNPDDDDQGDDDDREGHYPVGERTRIIISTHAQLGRRGWSQYVRALYRVMGAADDGSRPGFAVIIDEAAEWLRESRWEIGLAYRRKQVGDPEGGRLVPLRDCPKSNRSGHCGQCNLIRQGGSPRFNRFGIRELGHPPIVELDRQGHPLRTPRAPLVVAEEDMGLDRWVKVGETTVAARVVTWRGEAIDEWGRTSAPILLFGRSRDGHQPAEAAGEILGHVLRFAFRPVVTREFAVDASGALIPSQTLAILKRSGKRDWDEGITFPRLTCEVPRLRFTDLVAIERVRRHAEAERVGVILTGATLGPDDAETFRAVWPDLAVREHPYPDRKVRQVALVMPDGYVGAGALIGADGRLATAPLEAQGLGLVFCATKRIARPLYEAVCNQHPTARLAVENHMELTTRRTLHQEGAVGTIVTYSRGILGMGANLHNVRHLVADARAFRAISSFTPGDLTPEEFARSQAAERAALIVQNLGRALRGEAGKTVVLFVLNTDDELRAALATAPAIVEGSELTPVVVAPERADLPQLVGQAGRWLDANGGDWPTGDPGEAARKAKPGRKPRKTREDVLAAAESAIEAGMSWGDFVRANQPARQLPPEDVAELKARF